MCLALLLIFSIAVFTIGNATLHAEPSRGLPVSIVVEKHRGAGSFPLVGPHRQASLVV